MKTRKGFRWPLAALLLCSAVALSSVGLFAAESEIDTSIPPVDQSQDEMDRLLNLDVGELAKVSVSVTNPIVEGVSKKEETLAESPGIVDVITAKDIKDFGAKNLYEVLERATSVYMTGSFLFPRNVTSIRGNLIKHEDNHVLILINGRPFRDITLGGVNVSIYTAFPIETIDRIEVIRGPGSVLYGTNAFTGVINIVTKNPDKPTMQVSTLNGSYGWQSYNVTAGNGNEHGAVLAGTRYSRSEGWPFSATEDVVAPAPLDTDTVPWGEDNIGTFIMYRNGNFTANVFAARATEEMLGPDGAWPSDRLKDPRAFVDLGYLLEVDRFNSFQTNLTYNYDGTHFPSVVPGVPFDTASHSWVLEETYRADLTEKLDWLVGGFADFHQGFASMPPILEPIPAFTEIWYGVYTQLEYDLNDWIKMIGGMQANLPGEIRGGIVPRAGIIASLNENWTAKFLYGQSFRSPYQIERSIDIPGLLIGNPELSPEIMQTFDAQIAYRTEEFRLAATYFHSDFFDIVTRVGFPQTYENLGRMEFHGIELENDWELTENFRWLGSMTYQENVRDGVDNTTGVPNWMAKMGWAYNTDDGWNFGLFDVFYGRSTVPATAAIINPNPEAYHLMSLNTTLDLNKRLGLRTRSTMELQFLVQNLLGESIDHIEFERELINTFPGGAGRTYYGGFTMAY